MRIPKRNLNINDISLVDSLYQLVAELSYITGNDDLIKYIDGSSINLDVYENELHKVLKFVCEKIYINTGYNIYNIIKEQGFSEYLNHSEEFVLDIIGNYRATTGKNVDD